MSLTRFQEIFLLGQVIFLLTSLFTRVSLEKLCPEIVLGTSRNWPMAETWKTIYFSLVLILILIIVGTQAGPWINKLLYGSDTYYLKEIYPYILLGGGFGALASFLKRVLQNLKYRKAILVSYVLTFFSIVPVTDQLIRHWGFKGSSLAYMLGYMELSLLLVIIFFYESRKRRRASSNYDR